jgi:hypothetical protein
VDEIKYDVDASQYAQENSGSDTTDGVGEAPGIYLETPGVPGMEIPEHLEIPGVLGMEIPGVPGIEIPGVSGIEIPGVPEHLPRAPQVIPGAPDQLTGAFDEPEVYEEPIATPADPEPPTPTPKQIA